MPAILKRRENGPYVGAVSKAEAEKLEEYVKEKSITTPTDWDVHLVADTNVIDFMRRFIKRHYVVLTDERKINETIKRIGR